jgi:hypothetical protein
MSRPNIAGPTSARLAAGLDFGFAAIVILLMLSILYLAAWPRVTKNPRRCQPWVLVKFSRSTSANGMVGYDQYQNDSL